MQHNITKYVDESGSRKAVSWIQLNILGKVFCFNIKELSI